MKTLIGFAAGVLLASATFAAQPTITNTAAQTMMQNFLKAEAQRGELHQRYLEMLELWPMPERTPLEPEVTGTIEREEGFRVEKVPFQSRPKLYVTGNLYLPRDAKPGGNSLVPLPSKLPLTNAFVTKGEGSRRGEGAHHLPAVLYVCGHSRRGLDGNKTAFQHHGMWFATRGYTSAGVVGGNVSVRPEAALVSAH